MKLSQFIVVLIVTNAVLFINFIPIRAIENNQEVIQQGEEIDKSNILKLKKDINRKEVPIQQDVDNKVQGDGTDSSQVAGEDDPQQRVPYTTYNKYLIQHEYLVVMGI